jgi:phage/plasmid-like protein (TIGR03299 family)
MVINKEDIDKYLLISMSHDGTSSITVMFTPIRVVCNNTLSLALKGGLQKYTIRHTANARQKLEYAKTVLGLVDKQTLIYNQMFEALTTIKVSDMDAKYIMEKSLKLERDIDGELSTRANNILLSCEDYYHIGAGQENIVGTGWGVFNSISGYLQNAKEYKDNEAKFKNTFMTSGVTTRVEAYNSIMSLV